jgi:hypothetical protein
LRPESEEELQQARQPALPSGLPVGQVRVKSLELRQYEKEMLSLNIIAEMKTFWGFGDEKPTVQTNQYQYETAHEAAKNWLANEGESFSRGITQCVDRIVGYMARDLGYPSESQFD